MRGGVGGGMREGWVGVTTLFGVRLVMLKALAVD